MDFSLYFYALFLLFISIVGTASKQHMFAAYRPTLADAVAVVCDVNGSANNHNDDGYDSFYTLCWFAWGWGLFLSAAFGVL